MIVLNKRAAGFGMAGALALGTVVSAGALAPANAVDSTYTCTLSSGDVPLAVSGTLTLPASSVESGSSLAGMASSMGVTLPAPVVAGLAGLGIQKVGGTADGVAFPIGSTVSSIALNTISIPQTGPASDGSLTLAGTSTSKAGRAPLPGTYDVSMPSAFSFTPLADFGGGNIAPLPAVPCTTTTPASLGTLTVVKAASTTKASLANAPSKTSKVTKVLAKVRAAGYAAAGKVTAKMGTKTFKAQTLKSGKTVFSLGKLKAGKHTVKVFYKATNANKASSSSVSFTTKRG